MTFKFVDRQLEVSDAVFDVIGDLLNSDQINFTHGDCKSSEKKGCLVDKRKIRLNEIQSLKRAR